MGQTHDKLYMVDSFTSINDILGNFESERSRSETSRRKPRGKKGNQTIILSSDEHTGWTTPCTENYQFIGLAGAIIRGPLPKSRGDLIFENIIFKNRANQSLDFYGNHIFRNCEFHINISHTLAKARSPYVVETIGSVNEMSKIRYGLHIIGGSALFQNCIFRMTARHVNVFIAIGVDHRAPGIILQAPIIDIKYRNVAKLETFYVNSNNSENNAYCESYSGIIYYTNEQNSIYDGHCCQKRCSKKHCPKPNCNCRAYHTCCAKKCRKRTEIRLFRGVGPVITSFQSQTIHLNRGNGFFNIAHGDSLVYINGLTAIATGSIATGSIATGSIATGSNWEVGKFHNILLSSFVSNLKYASEIVETHCLKHGSETSSAPSGSLLPVYSSKPD
jgi:hypothetical protein